MKRTALIAALVSLIPLTASSFTANAEPYFGHRHVYRPMVHAPYFAPRHHVRPQWHPMVRWHRPHHWR